LLPVFFLIVFVLAPPTLLHPNTPLVVAIVVLNYGRKRLLENMELLFGSARIPYCISFIHNPHSSTSAFFPFHTL